MSTASSDRTAVVATYPANHYAEMAREFLEDNGIDASVIGDETHVPLQFTEGVRLIVMQDQVEAARNALGEASLLPDMIKMDPDEDEEE